MVSGTSRVLVRAAFMACVVLVLGGISGVPAAGPTRAQAQEDERGVQRFTEVKRWVGAFSWTGSGAGRNEISYGTLDWAGDHRANGTFVMEGPTFPYPNAPEYAVWTGTSEGTGSIEDEITLTSECTIQYEKWTGSGRMPGVLGAGDGLKPAAMTAELQINLKDGSYLFTMGPEGLDVSLYHRNSSTCGDYVTENTGEFTTMLGSGDFASGEARGEVPEEGLTIAGARSSQDILPQTLNMTGSGGKIDWNYHWTILPAGKEELEVVVEPQGFDEWLPEGGQVTTGGISVSYGPQTSARRFAAPPRQEEGEAQVTLGNTLDVKATLQAVGGGAPTQKVKKFTFELVEVSREPGIAMNAPKTGAKRDPDLDFDPQLNPPELIRIIPNSQGQRAETVKTGITQAGVVLRSHDWGAYGVLRVTAELESGRRIVGYLAGDKSQKEIRIPRRQPNSKIADKWKKDNGVAARADDDDTESSPDGNSGCPGDGLSLYEEYRGFFEWDKSARKDRQFRSNPKEKDFFIVDLIGTAYSARGITMFRSATRLAVHSDLQKHHVGNDLVINFNHGYAHLVNQHGVQLLPANLDGVAGGAQPRDERRGQGAGPPGWYKWIVIDTKLNPQGGEAKALRYASIVAHELAHTAGVHEHGEGDRDVQWIAWEDESGKMTVHEMNYGADSGDPLPIVVKDENGRVVDPNNAMFHVEGGLILRLGVKGGQHSGAEDCLMRYDNARAYVSDREPNVRYLVEEKRGVVLCSTTDGTGVNAPRHRPQSRYGPAAPNRGDCLHQLCVNDAVNPPRR